MNEQLEKLKALSERVAHDEDLRLIVDSIYSLAVAVQTQALTIAKLASTYKSDNMLEGRPSARAR